MTTTEPVAGRELDALVAECVMGYQRHVFEFNREQYALAPPEWPDWSIKAWLGRNVFRLVPEYSTSIEAAWQVVEHIATLGNPQWNNFIEELGGDDLYMLLNLNASEAAATICRAALVAVGKP